MFEMTNSGEDHGDLMVVGGVDDLFIAYRSARLDHCCCTGTDGLQETVGKREECIAGNDTSH